MDVSHLANNHMHYFNFKVWVEVTHSNRDIEFIQLRRWLLDLYDSKIIIANHKSCEMMSNDLYNTMKYRYPSQEIRIDISEEGINGSYTEYTI
jgi:hypothetical protein